MNHPAPGIYHGVPFEDYLRWPCLSQSTIKEGRNSMAAMRAAVLGERVKVPTDDMILGSAMHAAFLEPETMPTRVVKWEGGARRGGDWESFRQDHADKIILTDVMHAKLTGMVQAVRAHPYVRRSILPAIEAVEVSAVGTIEGHAVKGRADALMPGMVLDLKKMQSADHARVTSTVLNFGYHIQAAIYKRLFGRERFVLLVVEDSPPFDVVPYELSPAFIRAGDRDAMGFIQAYRHCLETGRFPGRSDDLVMLEVPEWAVSGETELVMPGDAPEFGG